MNDINDYLEETEFENIYVIKKWNKDVVEKYLDLGCQLVGMFTNVISAKLIPVTMLKIFSHHRSSDYNIFAGYRTFYISDFGISSKVLGNDDIKYRFVSEDSKTIMDQFLDSIEIYFYT